MGKLSCYVVLVSRYKLNRGEFATSRINRRALLFQSGGAVVATTVEAMALDAPRREPSTDLVALIEAHKSAYRALSKTVDEIGGRGLIFNDACRIEEETLMAVCAYPAVMEGDRLAKASYLLQIEARGELDLPQHIQAILRSTMQDL